MKMELSEMQEINTTLQSQSDKEDIQKLSRKKWDIINKKIKETAKLDFYERLSNSERYEDLEAVEKAKDIYKKNKHKHIYSTPKSHEKFIEEVLKVLKFDYEGQEIQSFNNFTSFANNVISEKLTEIQENKNVVTKFFRLYEKYRQDLDTLKRDEGFIKILSDNDNIKADNEKILLEIIAGLIINYLEVKSIELIQKEILKTLNIDYTPKLKIKPFKDSIYNFNSFIERQGFKADFSRDLEVSKEEKKKIVKENIDLETLKERHIQWLINSLIESLDFSIGISDIED